MTAENPQREIMPPVPSPETERFWQAARERRLLVAHCRSCSRAHYYPRSICPHCFSDDTEWKEAEGTGVVHSFSVMRRAPVPYAVAYVELAEGPRMLANIVNCDLDRLDVGQKVTLTFLDFEGGRLPAFQPATSPER